MKRKINEDDVPTPVDEKNEAANHPSSFEELHLDSRIRQALVRQELETPTAVQARSIPLVLQGKDILVQAKTGSGKTLCYGLPIIETILRKKSLNENSNEFALILVPTKELGDQVSKVLVAFTAYCAKSVRTLNLAQKISEGVQRSLLAEKPDIIVATPAGALNHLQDSSLELSNLFCLVLEEADVVLGYGYTEEDIAIIANAIPDSAQRILTSATLASEVDTLQNILCRHPIVLRMDEEGENPNPISQFVVKCAEDDKFLLIYVIVKLKLIKGKCIIFVGDIDRCYRLKLFLEQFGVRSCVLNSELPVNTRIHAIRAFREIFDILIAADENEVVGSEHTRKKRRTDDREYGISRGIDFKNVACVLNFDLPTSAKSYTHRIGRTGRAGKTGMALSFVIPKAQYRKHKPTSFPTAEHDEEVLAEIVKRQQKKGQEVKDYQFDMAQAGAFRYRVNDALRAVTGIAVREARTREIRQELINSDKLKRHFLEHPEDLRSLRHDGELRAARIQPHLKHIPDYLMPAGGKRSISEADIGFVGYKKSDSNRAKKANKRMRQKGRQSTGRKANPLKTFNAKGRKK